MEPVTVQGAAGQPRIEGRTPRGEDSDEAGLSAAASDFETFLSLLTAQMRNQDPLKPMESTEFVAQLASFSSVEQQIRSNERLDAILQALTGGGAAGLADWIDREVRSAAPAPFDGAPLEVGTSPQAGATRAVLVIRSAAGEELGRLETDPRASSIYWEGETGTRRLPPGDYAFSVEYLDDETFLGATEGQTYARVREVRLDRDQPRLVLESGAEISPEDATAVRAAGED